MICTNINATWDGSERCLGDAKWINYWQVSTDSKCHIHYLCDYCMSVETADHGFCLDRFEYILVVQRYSEEHDMMDAIFQGLWDSIKRVSDIQAGLDPKWSTGHRKAA